MLYGVIDSSRFCTLFNLALLVAKFYIYRCRLDDTPLYFPVFKTKLREKSRIEKDVATRKGNLKHFKIKWEHLIRSKFIGDVDIGETFDPLCNLYSYLFRCIYLSIFLFNRLCFLFVSICKEVQGITVIALYVC